MSIVARSDPTLPTALLADRMNAAQKAAARRAKSRPPTLTVPPGWASRAMPAAASSTQRPSSSRREPATATPRGPRNSMATTIPTGARLMAS